MDALPGTKQTLGSVQGYRYIEIVHPGRAYIWTEGSTGLKVLTNLTPDDCNRRSPADGVVFFRSDPELWGWALRIIKSKSTTDGVYNGQATGYGRTRPAWRTGDRGGGGE